MHDKPENFSLVIAPGYSDRNYWREVWKYRELFYFLALRDVLIRYKQTVLGIAWAVVRPFITMIVFTVIFGRLAALPSAGQPYPILVFAGLLPWQLFSGALVDSSASLLSNSALVSKVYFPRVMIPLSSIVVSFVDFLASLSILIGLFLWYGFVPPQNILALPLFLGIVALAAAGTGLWLGAACVRYRDIKFMVPFLVQTGLYISPVGFSSSVVPERWQLLYALNPMVGAIDGFRWCILGKGSFPVSSALTGLAVSTLLFWLGSRYFRKTEKTFADVI